MALSGSDSMEADVTYVGEMELATKADGKHKSVRLGQNIKGGVVIKSLKDILRRSPEAERLRWDVRLSPDLPIDLEINSGVTSSALDLSKLRLTALKVSTGTGKTVLSVPAGDSHYKVAISGGVGECNVEIAPNAEMELKLSNGTGATNLTIGADAAIDAHISGGLGQCTVELPRGAAVRLKASTGLGSIDVPHDFVRVKGGDDFISTSGTWETPDFASTALSHYHQVRRRHRSPAGQIRRGLSSAHPRTARRRTSGSPLQ
jgi:hypothetical protein